MSRLGTLILRPLAEVVGLIKKLNIENHVSIIMVTHDQHLAREANKTLQMFDGLLTSEVVNQQ